MTYNTDSSIQPVLYVIPEIKNLKIFFPFEQDILHQLDRSTGVIYVQYLQKCHRIFVYINSHLIDLICHYKKHYLYYLLYIK